MKTSNVSPDDILCVLGGMSAYVITYEKKSSVGLLSGSCDRKENDLNLSGNVFEFSKNDLREGFSPNATLEMISDGNCYLSLNEDNDVDFLGKKEKVDAKVLYFNRLTSATLLEALQVYRGRLDEIIKSMKPDLQKESKKDM